MKSWSIQTDVVGGIDFFDELCVGQVVEGVFVAFFEDFAVAAVSEGHPVAARTFDVDDRFAGAGKDALVGGGFHRGGDGDHLAVRYREIPDGGNGPEHHDQRDESEYSRGNPRKPAAYLVPDDRKEEDDQRDGQKQNGNGKEEDNIHSHIVERQTESGADENDAEQNPDCRNQNGRHSDRSDGERSVVADGHAGTVEHLCSGEEDEVPQNKDRRSQ